MQSTDLEDAGWVLAYQFLIPIACVATLFLLAWLKVPVGGCGASSALDEFGEPSTRKER